MTEEIESAVAANFEKIRDDINRKLEEVPNFLAEIRESVRMARESVEAAIACEKKRQERIAMAESASRRVAELEARIARLEKTAKRGAAA